MRRRLPMLVAVSALVLSVLAMAGSLIQITANLSEAQAQSSVRPPVGAVNTQGAQATAGGSVRAPASAATDAPAEPGVTRVPDFNPSATPAMPQGVEGGNSVSSIWGKMRHGTSGDVSIPDPQAGVLMQDAGMGWLEWRAEGGPLQIYGVKLHT